jgi:hypothetical protein
LIPLLEHLINTLIQSCGVKRASIVLEGDRIVLDMSWYNLIIVLKPSKQKHEAMIGDKPTAANGRPPHMHEHAPMNIIGGRDGDANKLPDML